MSRTAACLVFTDPRGVGEIEKILFDPAFKPKKKPLEADFFAEIIIKSTKQKKKLAKMLPATGMTTNPSQNAGLKMMVAHL